MNAKKICLLFVIVLVPGLMPQKTVSADMGPKPSFEFVFEQETLEPILKLVTWNLIKCDDNKCLNRENYVVYEGEKYFDCADNICRGVVNPTFVDDTDKSFQIEATFSDGKTRKSNIFTKSYYDARYKVIIKSDSLDAKETRGSNSSLYGIKLIETSCYWIPGFILVIIMVLIVVLMKRKQAPSLDENDPSPRFSGFLWVGIVVFSLLGLVSNPLTFILTMIVESSLAIAYLKIVKIPFKRILYGVLVANVFTQPVFTIVLRNLNLVDDIIRNLNLPLDFTVVVILEILIWLVEAAIINKIQDKQIPVRNVFLLTFILNGVSFGVGMLPTYYIIRAFL